MISGSADACERALAEAEKMELRAAALTVAGAFHSPLMQPAADRMADALGRVTFNPPAVPVCSNVTGGAHGQDTDPINGPSYYYARVIQTDEEIAWSSPVWLE